MALLNEINRVTIWEQIMRDNRNPIAVLKMELRAAVDAADQWAEDNATSFNQALPVIARTNLTAKQKAMLLMFILAKRYGVL